MSLSYKSEFKFLGYNINYIKFESNKNYHDEENKLKIKFDYNVKKNEIYEVTLKSEIGDKNDSPFFIEASITGDFEISTDNINKEMINILVNQNTLAILFPYLRSLITTVTANCNINPVILPTINISKLLNEN